MEKCDSCEKLRYLIFSFNNKRICSDCLNKLIPIKIKNKKVKRSRKIIIKQKILIPEKKITEEDIRRNIQLVKNDGELDISLKKIKDYLKSKDKNFTPLIAYKKYIPQEEKVLKCFVCKNTFISNRIKKYCSLRCKKIRLNEQYLNWFNNRMKNDWQFALKVRLRDNLRDAIRYYNKTGKLRKHVRSNKYIDYEGIIKHLGPCPGNRREWHIDHIKPLIAFDFSNTSEIRKAFAPSNLRWITAKENLKKGKKI